MKRSLVSFSACCLCGGSFVFGAGFAELSGEWRLESLVIPSHVSGGIPSSDFEAQSIDATFSDVATFEFTQFGKSGEQDEMGSGVLFFFGSELRTLGIVGGDIEDIETENPLRANVSVARDTMSVSEPGDPGFPIESYNLGVLVKAPESLTLAEMEGAWVAHFVEFPSEIVNGGFSIPFDSETTQVDIDAAGNATAEGESIGAISVPNNRRFIFNDGEQQTFFINDSKDVAVGNSSESEETVFDVLVKKPEMLSVSELAGEWRMLIIAAPNVESFEPPNDDLDRFDGFSGTLVIDEAGNVSGDSEGTLTVNPDNTVTFADQENDGIVLSVNASKNFIVTMFKNEEFVDVTILVRIRSAPARTDGIIDIVSTEQLTVEFDAESSPTLELLHSSDLRNWLLYPLDDGETVVPMFDDAGEAVYYQTIEND